MATALGFLFWRRDRLTVGVSVLALCFLLFLGRGGVVIFYYVIPLLGLGALALGLVAGHLIDIAARLRPMRMRPSTLALAAAVAFSSVAAERNHTSFSVDATRGQAQAAEWVAGNLPRDSLVIMDSYVWQDLRDPHFVGGAPFSRAYYYWPTLSDANLREKLLDNTWQKMDYLLISSNSLTDARAVASSPFFPRLCRVPT